MAGVPLAQPRRPLLDPGWALPVLLLAAFVVLVAAYLLAYVPQQRREFLAALASDLGNRADAGQQSIERWIEDDLDDAATVAFHPSTLALVARPGATAAGAPHVDDVLTHFARIQGFRQVVVFDRRLQVLARARTPDAPGAAEVAFARAVLSRGRDSVDFIRTGSGAPRIAYVTCIPGATADDPVRSAVLIETDPAAWLFPYLAVPRTAARTSETLLLRIERDSLLYLSPLRTGPAVPMTRRAWVGAAGPFLQSALAGPGAFGTFTDERGIRALAAVRGIRGAPWMLMVRVEERDVMSSFGRRMTERGLGVGLLAAALTGLALALWRGQRRAHEATLARSRARIAALLDQANDPILFVAPDGVVRETNRRAEEFYRTAPGGLVGRHVLHDLRAPELRQQGGRQLEQALREGRLQFETVHLATDGERLPVEVSVSRIDQEGETTLVGVVHDLRERRAAEARLREQYSILQSVFESVGALLFSVDRDYRYTSFNSAHAAVMRALYGVDIAVGRSVLDCMRVEEDRRVARANLDRALAGETFVDEAPSGEAARTRRWFEVSHGPIRSASGEVVGVVVGARDVTERRRAEERLRKLSRAVEGSPAAIVITDTEGTIEYVNPSFLAITGYALDEVIGRNPRLLRSGEMDPSVYAELWACLRAGGEWRGELLNRRKNGDLYWEDVSISPLRDEQGNISHFVGIQEDITDRKRAQETLRTTQMQLLQAQKMETVGRLAGGVAHDFNNLLTIIHGYGELLEASLPASSDARPQVAEILAAADRAAQLTRQLLAFSRRQILEPRVIDLGALVGDSERMLRRLIGEDITLEVLRPRYLGRVKADPGQIEQALLNLVINSRDAMPDGGRVTLELADVELDHAYVSAHEPIVPGRYVMLAVSDTGSGMTADVRAHIFEPFFTTKELGKGTGLGLATVYGIVKQSGGYIWAYSEPGQGATFKIYLPRVEVPAEPAPGPAALEIPMGRGEQVLLVEDDEAVRKLARTLLEERGFAVIEAGTGEEALELAAGHPGPIDLLVADVIMSGINGNELARRLEAARPALRVLFVSGYPYDTIAHHGVLEPGVRLLQKPFTSRGLIQAVHEALRAPIAGPRG